MTKSVQQWLDNARVAVIGQGYVGLPLAVEFGKVMPCIGFDIQKRRIDALRDGRDDTLEVSEAELAEATQLTFSSEPEDLKECNIFIVAVPTPIDAVKRPDLRALTGASKVVAASLKKGDTVIYESTVYPGCTEERCVPVLEKESGLKLNRDFFVGYSPERINPGDKTRRLPDIVKVTSASTPEALARVDALYARIVTAGTYPAKSIKVAEAAKVIENTQRDLNIALVNELAIMFHLLDIDTNDVLDAAGTKWNFLPFRPGLVGGHCIGVDPYYLTHKAAEIGYHPEIVLAGRRLNDGMGAYVAQQAVKKLLKRRIHVDGARILVAGFTFKENCPDVRNSRVIDVVRELEGFGCTVDVHDPWADIDATKAEYGIDLMAKPDTGAYDGIVLTVGHDVFREKGAAHFRTFGRPQHVLFDVKAVFDAQDSDMRL
ncbi:Vi polysaccharide biosynthesis UDP-N-acetylglucosamine C-6 dehydrogenase TviB [Croceicoccus ponticola]|uniref:Vi polysaccharide biosynthesis UDP-N-acetylglucosamine C-6 dehydrogenase TviB n=1 Tax=Croceicoccus ponticola TaxID=2217664 RepID=A0A437GY66_9SPHN|nr:Vi polysaccharide biosynthesis UDP-N-acetylglucosamine C-6 dehydrogenase TviB [Croceicoccus ponticola]RVQ67627.1 Vi polysaccharide biosynthesis UDP-N-acetylglucosamine C-6 dehydrogenase TviB [Croceicoccus ponticola]